MRQGCEDGAHDHPRSEPAPDAEDEAHVAGALARLAGEICRLPECPSVGDADIGREFPADLIPQPQPGIDVGNPAPTGGPGSALL